MNEPLTEPLDPEVEALVLKELEKRVKARIDGVKATFGQRYPDGHRENFWVGTLKLGTVYRTDPVPTWTVTNPEALHAHLRQFPGSMETVYEIADEVAAVEVLKEHAPHLLVEITRVNPGHIAEALQESRDNGAAAAPGIELVKPGGSVTVKPDLRQAGAAVELLIRQGHITWDGRRVLEAKKAAS